MSDISGANDTSGATGPGFAAGEHTRALAALRGLAIGDALGMPTQMMSRERVAQRFGAITDFRAADDDHPLAAGMPAGSITDDTEQALVLATLLVTGQGRINPEDFAQALVHWENSMRARGSLDLLGPSTKRAVDAVLAGEPLTEAGRFGTTNGAAMRVAPVGIACSWGDPGALIDLVVEASVVSHNTTVALSAAAAVAAAVSAGVDGAGMPGALSAALDAAALASHRGYWVAGADIGRRIRWATELVNPLEVERSLADVSGLIGTSLASQESVPAAFGLLALFPDDPWRAVLAAASLGGDSDTIAAIAGAIGGAVYGSEAFPAEAVATVERVNELNLEPLVSALLELR